MTNSAPALNPAVKVSPAPALNRSGRQPKARTWTDAEAQHDADVFLAGGVTAYEVELLRLLRDFFALTEERLFALMQRTAKAAGGYHSLCVVLNRKRAAGLVALASENVVSSDLQAAGLQPIREGNRRFARVWTLGPVGRVLVPMLWDVPFTPVGGIAHTAHHALAAEAMFRFQDAAQALRGKTYDVQGPRDVAIWDSEKKITACAPDGLLVERKPDGAPGIVWAVEYHNEPKAGRAKDKIESYDRLVRHEDAWQAAWGVETFPKVLVVWRHEPVLRDYARQLRALAGQRGDRAVAFSSLALSDSLSSVDGAVRVKKIGAQTHEH